MNPETEENELGTPEGHLRVTVGRHMSEADYDRRWKRPVAGIPDLVHVDKITSNSKQLFCSGSNPHT